MGATVTLSYTGNTVTTLLTFPAATPSDIFCPLYYNIYIT